jgi:hypothetical protein
MSKQLFEMMQAEQLSSLYDATFTKKEAVKAGTELTKRVFEVGNVDKLHFVANLARFEAVISAAMTEARNEIIDIEKSSALGVEFTPVNSGETLNYKDDPIWSDIKRELTEREELLKLAYKSKNEIYDSEGVEVTKVSSTPRKSSVTIKF